MENFLHAWSPYFKNSRRFFRHPRIKKTSVKSMRDDVYRATLSPDMILSYLLSQFENEVGLTMQLVNHHPVWVMVKSTTQFPTGATVLPAPVAAQNMSYRYDVYFFNIPPPTSFVDNGRFRLEQSIPTGNKLLYHYSHVCTLKEDHVRTTSEVIGPLFDNLRDHMIQVPNAAKSETHTLKRAGNATRLYSWNCFRYPPPPPPAEGEGGISRRNTLPAFGV